MLRDKVFKSGRWTATSAVVNFALQLISLVFLSRLLDPEDFGIFAMIMVVVGFATSIADLGLGNFLIQVETLNKAMLSRIIVSVFILSIMLSVGLLLSTNLISGYYKQPVLSRILPGLVVYFLFFVLGQLLIALLQRNFQFRLIAIGEISSGIVSTSTTVILAYLGFGIWALVTGQIVIALSKFLFFVFPVIKSARILPVGEGEFDSGIKSFAFFQTGERALNYLGANMDKMFIGRGLGDAQLGIYTLPFQLILKPILIINPIFSRVAFPAFVNLRKDNSKLIKGYLELLRLNAFVTLPIFLFMAFASNVIVELLLGPKWVEAGSILYFLSFLGMFLVLGNPMGILVLAKGKPNWSFYWNLLATGIYSVVFWFGSHYSSLIVAKLYLMVAALILFPLEFYLRYRLVGMTALNYLVSMCHLLVAALIPIFLHLCFIFNGLNSNDIMYQLMVSIGLTLFFFGYLFIYNRSLFIMLQKIIKT